MGDDHMLENGMETCNCSKKSCIRHGKCRECMEYHRLDNKRVPYCKRNRMSIKKILMFSTFGILLIALLAGIGVYSTVKIMGNKYPEVSGMVINNVELSQIKDGTYTGEFSYGKSTYGVVVVIKNGKYHSISVNSNRNDKYSKRAQTIIERIIEEQSLNVEVISGATRSSKAILKAIENAL